MEEEVNAELRGEYVYEEGREEQAKKDNDLRTTTTQPYTHTHTHTPTHPQTHTRENRGWCDCNFLQT